MNCEKTSSKVSKNSTSTQKSKSNECTLSVKYDKSPSIVSNNFKNSSSIQKSKSNECTSSVECDKLLWLFPIILKTLLQLKNQNQMNVLRQ